MLRILLVEDQPIIRHGIRALAQTHDGWDVCGETDDSGEVLRWTAARRPHLLLIEVSLAGLNGPGLIRQVRKRHPGTEILVFTTREDTGTVCGCLAAGAQGHVFKTDGREHLDAAIAALGARRTYLSPAVTAVVTAAAGVMREPAVFETCTCRELEVAQMMIDGQSNKQIARTLGITPKTVECHRAALLRKADAKSAAAFVSFAIRNNLIRA